MYKVQNRGKEVRGVAVAAVLPQKYSSEISLRYVYSTSAHRNRFLNIQLPFRSNLYTHFIRHIDFISTKTQNTPLCFDTDQPLSKGTSSRGRKQGANERELMFRTGTFLKVIYSTKEKVLVSVSTIFSKIVE